MAVTEAELKGPRPLLEDNAVPLLCPSSLLATPREGELPNATMKRCAAQVAENFKKVVVMQVTLLQARLTSQFKEALVDLGIEVSPHGDIRDEEVASDIASPLRLTEAGVQGLDKAATERFYKERSVEKKLLIDSAHGMSTCSNDLTSFATDSNTPRGLIKFRSINPMLRAVNSLDDKEGACRTFSISSTRSIKSSQNSLRRSKYLVGRAVAAGITDAPEPGITRWGSLVQRVIEANDIAEKLDDDDDDLFYEFHPDWINKDHCQMNATLLASFRTLSEIQRSSSRNSFTDEVRFDDVMMENSRLQWFAIHPHSLQRCVWGIAGALLLLYDLVTLPLILTFEIESPRAFQMLEYLAFVYWLLDLLMNFFLGFMKDGLLEMRVKQIVVNYVRTWLLADLLIIIMDIAFFLFGSLDTASSALRVSKSLRVMRMLRLIRLVRLVRMRKLVDVIKTFWHDIRSDYNKLTLRLARNIFSILILNHYIACMWYGLADMSEQDDSWVHKYQLDQHGIVYSYAMSMHWALCQFTPATNNVHPGNVTERVFACVLVIFALVAFSSFVSGTTNAVSQLRALNQDKLMEGTRIRNFITDRKLSYRLGNQILTFFHANYKRTHRPHEKDIKFFNEVPQSMMLRLHEEIYHPILMTNWMFFAFRDVNPEFWKKLCHFAVAEKTYTSQQDVFISNTQSDRLYFVEAGTIRYISDCDESDVYTGSWLAEMSLWVKWIHIGQVTADTTCEMLEIDCNLFRQVALHRGGTILSCLKKFAVFLVGYVERIGSEVDNAISDLPLPSNVLKDLGNRILKLHHRHSQAVYERQPTY